jgi:hypothetical protein
VSDGRDHLESVLLETLLPIVDELQARLEADLSAKDTLAVETAIRKAAAEGVRLASLEVSAQAAAEGWRPASLGSVSRAQADGGLLGADLDIQPADAWAERYGG